MLRFNVPVLKKSNLSGHPASRRSRDRSRTPIGGFTLVEILLVVIIVGSMSAIAAPSLVRWANSVRMTNAVNQVQGALLEAQRQAIRSSRSCPITLSSTSVSGSCLLTGTRQLQGVSLQASSTSFQFNLKGAVTNSSSQLLTAPVTIVISAPAATRQRCLVVSAPLGFVKTGNYSGSGTNDQNCIP